MRRLVAISGRPSKAIMAIAASTIALTSIHLAAAARTASLQREQQRLELAAVTARPPASNPRTQITPATVDVPIVPARHIVISIADRKLAVIEERQVLKIYSIAVGTSQSPSPDGDFFIINRAKDPVYRHAHQEVSPGKDNPLGSRWMGLSLKGYGIHGTNVQSSVGKASSHGCFRMRKKDVEELYTLVKVGDAVTVRRERDTMIAQVFAEPPAVGEALAAKPQSSTDMQVASATVTMIETTQQ
ncbi:MAG: L,D-transpeptidase [Candidatus Angelobacter sp.]